MTEQEQLLALRAERARLMAHIAELTKEEDMVLPKAARRVKGPSVGRIPWLPHIDEETRARFRPRDHTPLNPIESEVAGMQRLVVTLQGDAAEDLQHDRKRDHRGWVEVKHKWQEVK
jgi:hypothetical protein